MQEPAHGVWPRGWPLAAQVTLGITCLIPLYWAHRMGHEWLFLWRFHALHHSVTRLWIVNTGRFHFMDSLFKIVLSVALFDPRRAAAVSSGGWRVHRLHRHADPLQRRHALFLRFVILRHARLHRWHHSKVLREANNYGENVMFDLLFGTYFRIPPPAGRYRHSGIYSTAFR